LDKVSIFVQPYILEGDVETCPQLRLLIDRIMMLDRGGSYGLCS